jgi:endonuclease III related protein
LSAYVVDIHHKMLVYRTDVQKHLLCIYERLNAYFGNLHWWPGDSPFEVIAGAILTQNTSWLNVEIAINNLKSKGCLCPEAMVAMDDHVLSDLIRSSGYHNVKSQRLKSFVRYLYMEHGGSLDAMFLEETDILREKLLTIKGIGDETADSILLYAGGKPVFVIDAYTRRILERHGLVKTGMTYSDIQELFVNNLPCSVSLFNQYHALLVNTGKRFCKRSTRCHECPLGEMMPKSNFQNINENKCFT